MHLNLCFCLCICFCCAQPFGSHAAPCIRAQSDATGLQVDMSGGVLCFFVVTTATRGLLSCALQTDPARTHAGATDSDHDQEESIIRSEWDADTRQLHCYVPPASTARVSRLRAGVGLHWVLRAVVASPVTHLNLGAGHMLVSAPGWINLDSLRGDRDARALDWGTPQLQAAVQAASTAANGSLVQWEASSGLRFLPSGSVRLVMIHCLLYALPLHLSRALLAEAKRVLAADGVVRIAESGDGRIWAGDGLIGLPSNEVEQEAYRAAAAKAAAAATAGTVATPGPGVPKPAAPGSTGEGVTAFAEALTAAKAGRVALPGDIGRPTGSLQHWVRAELAQALDMSPAVELGPFRTRSGTLCALHALHPMCRNCAAAQLDLQRHGKPFDFNNTCWICHFHLAPAMPMPTSAAYEHSERFYFKDTWNGQSVAFGRYWAVESSLRDTTTAGFGVTADAAREVNVAEEWPWAEDKLDTRDCFGLTTHLLSNNVYT